MPMSRGLIHPVDLMLPHLPCELEGLKIVHLSDLHIRRARPRHRRIIAALSLLNIDLAVLTGDYIDRPGFEQVGLAIMTEVCDILKPRLGSFGVFGNHDPYGLPALFEQLPIRWLHDEAVPLPDTPLELIGFSASRSHLPDAVASLENLTHPHKSHNATAKPSTQPLRVLLSHYPTYLPTAADMAVDLMFSGHTHGGQCRLPGPRPYVNSTDLPRHLTSGLLRHHNTLCAVSRGLGEAWIPFRIFCPPQIPIYTLHRGPMPGQPTDHIVNLMPW